MKRALLLPVAAMVILTAPTGASAQQEAPRATVQQQFDSSTAALEAERWDEALRLLEALETRLARGRDQGSLGIVRVRKGQALLGLGRVEEAVAALRLGLPALSATNPALNEDRFHAYLTLGQASELALDYRQAAEHYRAAEAVAVEPNTKLLLYRGLIQTQMFHDAPAALADADDALRLAATTGARGREVEGQFRTFRGRVLLNMGRHEEARTELARAMRLLGGPSLRVNISDIVARSDLAIAAMLTGHADEARRFLALTGAGHMDIASLPLGRMAAPPCSNGLQPDDVAVVEFSIREGGGVGSATPVYSSRQGDAALRFAEAVRRWSWSPQSIRRMAPFFRAAVRVELRCSMSVAARTAAVDAEETARWASANGVAIALLPRTDRDAAELRRDLAAAEARSGAASPQLLPALVRLGLSPEPEPAEQAGLLRRALPIATAARTPAPYREMIAFALASALQQMAGREPWDDMDHLSLLAEPGIGGDPHLGAAFHLAAARARVEEGQIDQAAELVERTRALPAVAADQRLTAQLQEVVMAIATARGQAPAAGAAYNALPAGAYPCMITPRRRRAGATFNDFPNAALQWGFEGWVVLESVIDAEGTPASARVLASYPPFVFNEAGTAIVARSRYESTFVPPHGPCATTGQRVVFRLP